MHALPFTEGGCPPSLWPRRIGPVDLYFSYAQKQSRETRPQPIANGCLQLRTRKDRAMNSTIRKPQATANAHSQSRRPNKNRSRIRLDRAAGHYMRAGCSRICSDLRQHVFFADDPHRTTILGKEWPRRVDATSGPSEPLRGSRSYMSRGRRIGR